VGFDDFLKNNDFLDFFMQKILTYKKGWIINGITIKNPEPDLTRNGVNQKPKPSGGGQPGKDKKNENIRRGQLRPERNNIN
jgi:hypothetical protein